MTKSFAWSLVFCFFFCVLLDQVSKQYFSILLNATSLGPIDFDLVYNRGIMLGHLSHMPDALRVVTISTFYGFLFSVFLLIQYLLVAKLPALRTGLTLFFAGITGNTIDRAVFGSVTDFISIVAGTYFNIADFFQLLGFIMITYSLFRHHEEIWHPNCVRKSYIVNFKLQAMFALKFTFFSLALALLIGIFTISFLTLLSISQEHITAFILSYTAITLLFLLISFVGGFIISHRYLGPVHAFELFINDVEAGKEREFRLRQSDQFKVLETIAKKINQKKFPK